jgi:hypothetical protein
MKRIALIAHDNRKQDLLDWARYNVGTLAKHELFATGTTGALLAAELGLERRRSTSDSSPRESRRTATDRDAHQTDVSVVGPFGDHRWA